MSKVSYSEALHSVSYFNSKQIFHSVNTLPVPFQASSKKIQLPFVSILSLKSKLAGKVFTGKAFSNSFGYQNVTTCSFASGRNDISAEKLPESREDAIRQAQTSLTAVVGKSLTRTAGVESDSEQKKRKQPRLRVEIPVLDDSAASIVVLSHDLIKNLFTKRRNSPGICIYFSDPEAATIAFKKFNGSINSMPVFIHSLDEVNETDIRASGIVFIIQPNEDQIQLVNQLASSSRPRPCVVLNPSWSPEASREEDEKSVVDSFQVCYSFMPLQIQGFLTKYEGAVMKFVRGTVEATPWLIFTKQGEGMKCVLRMKERPETQQLETALYQVNAATSPVGRTINFVTKLGKTVMGKSK